MAAGWIDANEPDRQKRLSAGGGSETGDGGTASAKWWASELGREALDQIVRAISSVSYGQVVIMVQDGKVVQIDRTEKVRLR
ncbi:MAG: YezD family protein [Firmicutes bacterium]|nr:YezD family protein [Bacillota bacterium]MDH7495189.1 YezD family protein [Bacillota bacterium]